MTYLEPAIYLMLTWAYTPNARSPDRMAVQPTERPFTGPRAGPGLVPVLLG